MITKAIYLLFQVLLIGVIFLNIQVGEHISYIKVQLKALIGGAQQVSVTEESFCCNGTIKTMTKLDWRLSFWKEL